MIHFYYGYGKGKTTAAIGAGMRAKGSGLKVAFVQFFKDNKSSELKTLPFEIFEAPESLPFNPDESYKVWVNSAIDFVKSNDADVIILDEFADLIPKFLSAKAAVELLNGEREYIVTGHARIAELASVADYVTNMQKEKHPFDNGVKARLGIEY